MVLQTKTAIKLGDTTLTTQVDTDNGDSSSINMQVVDTNTHAFTFAKFKGSDATLELLGSSTGSKGTLNANVVSSTLTTESGTVSDGTDTLILEPHILRFNRAATLTTVGGLTLSDAANSGSSAHLLLKGSEISNPNLVLSGSTMIHLNTGELIVGNNSGTGGKIHSTTSDGVGVLTINPSPSDNRGKLVVKGDFFVEGTTTTVNSTEITMADAILELNGGNAAKDAGIRINREGKSAVSLLWDESEEHWDTGSSSIKAGRFIGTADDVADLNSFSTNHLQEGTNLYFTDSRARDALSVSSSGDGSLAYDSSTGQFTYTGPSGALTYGSSVNQGGSSDNEHDSWIGRNSRSVGSRSVTLGWQSGGGNDAVCIGKYAGHGGSNSIVAVGSSSLSHGAGHYAVGLGHAAGGHASRIGSVSIGYFASQWVAGEYSIAIGYKAGDADTNQGGSRVGSSNNSIILNATGSRLNATVSGFHVAPVRENGGTNILSYNNSSSEISYLADGNNGQFLQTNGSGLVSWADVRDQFSAGIGVSYNSSNGQFSIGQSVATNADVTFKTVTANVTGQVSDIANHTTDDLTEGSTNEYFTDARARGALSVESRGPGSLAYDSSTGKFSYTGPTSSEILANVSAGTGLSITSGKFSLGTSLLSETINSNANTTKDLASLLKTSAFSNSSGGAATLYVSCGNATVSAISMGVYHAIVLFDSVHIVSQLEASSSGIDLHLNGNNLYVNNASNNSVNLSIRVVVQFDNSIHL